MSVPPIAFDPKLIEMLVHQGIPHCRELGVGVEEVTGKRAVLKLPYQERLIGNPETGIIAGGAVTTLVDTCCGMAVQLALGKLMAIATLDLRIDYLRPSAPRRDVYAAADCYKLTRQIAFVRAHAWNDDESDPIANCVATFMVGSSDRPILPPEAESEARAAVKRKE